MPPHRIYKIAFAKKPVGNRFANLLARPELYNFWSSGDEVLELSTNGTPYALELAWQYVNPWGGDMRRYTWQKQEHYKGRSVIYGTGWAGWGFESNCVPSFANAAGDSAIRDAPIFEHDPSDMFTNSISQARLNKMLVKGIPALSKPAGYGTLTVISPIRNYNMDSDSYKPSAGWCRNHETYGDAWLHSDIQDVAYYYTRLLYDELTLQGELR